ncbi:hypothetical protein I7I48_04640 [Histoplasma ohiense]|nr:hypothetical protein I7I48_04640 [Histoplasma ohiense (nom. inval.)]
MAGNAAQLNFPLFTPAWQVRMMLTMATTTTATALPSAHLAPATPAASPASVSRSPPARGHRNTRRRHPGRPLPRDPNDVMCCTDKAPPPPPAGRKCNARGVPGVLHEKKSACRGTATPGAGTPSDPWTCPHDPNDVMCCTDKKPPPPPARPSVRIPEYRCKRHVIDAGYKIMGANRGKVRSVGCYGKRSGKSEHPLGLALDLMTGLAQAHSPNGQPLAEWVMYHAIELKIKYVICGQRIWEAGQSVQGWAQWEKMEDRGGLTANHWDHVHVSFHP